MYKFNRTQEVANLRTSAVTPILRTENELLDDLAPGEYVTAHVEAALGDKTYRLKVNERTLVLRLPVQARPGDTLELSRLNDGPQRAPGAVNVQAITATNIKLSAAARFISALVAESSNVPVAAGTRASAPLLLTMPADGSAVAAQLRDALSASGLFYEAHLAEWAAGGRSLASLMREPQNLLQPRRLARADAAGAADSADKTANFPGDVQTLATVRQQLATLENNVIHWHGSIWPGQLLEWEIREDEQASRDAGHAPSWQTRLRLELPRLGEIDVLLHVSGNNVTIAVRGPDESLDALATARPALAKALHSAGVTPLDITVRNHEAVEESA